MTAQNIHLIGGSGFVGTLLCARLAALGHSVTVLSRYREASRHLLVNPQVKVVQPRNYSKEAFSDAISGADIVINLAAILNEPGRNNGSGFEKAHVTLIENLVSACKEVHVGKLIQISALKADAEDAPSHYLRSKGKAENHIKRHSGQALKWTIFQPSIIFGPDDSFINRFAKLLALPAPFMPLPRANARFAPVYVNDVVSAIIEAVDKPQTNGKTFQLCGPEVFSLREILRLICKVQGIKKPIVAMPDALAKFQAIFTGNIPGKPFSRDNFDSLTVHSICDKNGFEKLGIEPEAPTAILPTFLSDMRIDRRYDQMRKTAGR